MIVDGCGVFLRQFYFDEFLSGSEAVPDARAIIQLVLDARYAEADARQQAIRAQEAQKWRDASTALLLLGACAGVVVLALKYPAYTLPVLNWIEQTFCLTAGVGRQQ